jgi:hypothetical protein
VSAIYEYIGRFIVRLAWFRFGRQIKVAGVAAALLAAAGAFLIARHNPPEG